MMTTDATTTQGKDAHCPECGLPWSALPFCPRDGSLRAGEPFVIGERYRVEERLGHGGSAVVLGARHLILGKSVAMKVLRPEVASADGVESQRFLRQARIASQLSHENIVSITDFGHDDVYGVDYLVMDRLSGPTLAEVIRRDGPLPWTRVIPILMQLCRALSEAHAHGVIHRDLNPRNVMLVANSGRTDVVKLCDFGLSRFTSGQGRVTATGALLGTPAYMAPEQIHGAAEQDERVDLYALGVTAYEMLTSTLPHDGATPVAMIASKISSPAPAMSLRTPHVSVPAPLEALVLRLLAERADDRPRTAAEVEDALASITVSGSGSGPRTRIAPVTGNDVVGATIGSYVVTRLLGTGGVGSVYLGEHPMIGTKVAIKVLLPEVVHFPGIVDRFVQEARAASEIGDPRIPRYYDFGFLPGGRPYAVMEYLEGQTLADRIAQGGPLSVADAAALGVQVAEAVGKAHAAGVVHRDLKPENLFLVQTRDGSTGLKVLDFGIAKMLTPGASTVKTQLGFVAGTLVYCPPEQLFGQNIGPTADVYALGATLYELLTGALPFDGEASQVMSMKASQDAPLIRTLRPELPVVVEQTIAKMLSRRIDDRPQSMEEVCALLAQWTAPQSARPHATPPVSSLPPRVEGPKRATLPLVAIAAAAAGLVLLLAVVGGAMLASRGSPKDQQNQALVGAEPVAARSPATAGAPSANGAGASRVGNAAGSVGVGAGGATASRSSSPSASTAVQSPTAGGHGALPSASAGSGAAASHVAVTGAAANAPSAGTSTRAGAAGVSTGTSPTAAGSLARNTGMTPTAQTHRAEAGVAGTNAHGSGAQSAGLGGARPHPTGASTAGAGARAAAASTGQAPGGRAARGARPAGNGARTTRPATNDTPAGAVRATGHDVMVFDPFLR